MMQAQVTLTIDAVPVAATVDVRTSLADFVREQAGRTGTKIGCEHGVCGACTVLVDGAAVRSCLLFAVQADGAQVTTVESLAGDDGLHPVQDAFHRHHALQCGFCTPGVLMTTVALLAEEGTPDEVGIRTALSGNLCRCTGYQGMVEAVAELLAQRDGERGRERESGAAA